MADLPILFSAPMVRALIAGTKTQTRRTFGKLRRFGKISEFGVSDTPGYAWHFRDKGARWHDLRDEEIFDYLPYKAGDRLYVREAWRVSKGLDGHSPAHSHKGKPVLRPRTMTVFFDADGSISNNGDPLAWQPDAWPEAGSRPDWAGKNRQAMHLPRWASRITLIVEGVKIEQLQDISEEDAIAEGWPHAQTGGVGVPLRDAYPIGWYGNLWNDINGPAAWAANPWVVAYTFRRIMGNIDMIEKGAA